MTVFGLQVLVSLFLCALTVSPTQYARPVINTNILAIAKQICLVRYYDQCKECVLCIMYYAYDLRGPEPIYMRVGREHVKANPEILTILSCARVSIVVENWMASRFSRRSGFISPQNENLSSQKLPRGFRRCYILFC